MSARQPYFTAAQIATVAGTYKRAIVRRAEREAWPRRRSRNRIVFVASPEHGAACLARFTPAELPDHDALFAGLRRAFGVFEVLRLLRLDPRVSVQSAASVVCFQNATLKFSEASLVRWFQRAERHGLAGLADDRATKSGRKPTRKI